MPQDSKLVDHWTVEGVLCVISRDGTGGYIGQVELRDKSIDVEKVPCEGEYDGVIGDLAICYLDERDRGAVTRWARRLEQRRLAEQVL